MYQYLPNVAGVSMSPQAHNGAQADAPARTPAQTPAKTPGATPSTPARGDSSSSSAAAPSQAAETRGPDTGFLHKEASLARRARAQMISAEPKPTTLGWRMAVDRLTETLQQMERAISTAQIKPPISNPGLPPMPALEVLKTADRVTAFYEEQDTVQPHPSTSQTAVAISALAQVAAPAQRMDSSSPAAVPVPEAATVINAFVEREERAAARAAAEPEDSTKQLLNMALSGYAQPSFEPEKPGDP
ncbi:hypothetical protein TRM7557_00260 [Tritonibacter multivorans]|uniref:Uncharacterized protein n=1 Tax=Tritonibacter multivorans TaxID=928856 RepID=A0A0P1GKD1_9RHOB|nr:hypothetical protein [Tritonibacter multivorans]MDA7419302.1 hypothetical protein [Tritonibacter multivorans]CUH75187.1 hypothetical protein TRM7557_00260 [Tritonibacter multivorans]SFD23065.1 hypothetical protein SAMN04488049_109102 [Tritonibacter multivorans]